MSIVVRLITMSFLCCFAFILNEGIRAQNMESSSPFNSPPIRSIRSTQDDGLNDTQQNETLLPLEEDEGFNFNFTTFQNNTNCTGNNSLNETTDGCNDGLNNTQQNETLLPLEEDEGFNFNFTTFQNSTNCTSNNSLNETTDGCNDGLNKTQQNETLLPLEDDEGFNFNFTTFQNNTNCTGNNNLNETTDGCNDVEVKVEVEEEEYKFIEPKKARIVVEHTDFVLMRLQHIAMRTSSNITELMELQQEEFEVNPNYKYAWEAAANFFNYTIREKLYNISAPDSIVRQVPEEYHIAIIAYTGWLYWKFNEETREVCSGSDIDKYQYKSYFKLLKLAVETLGTQEEKWRDNRRFLYRGASREYDLKEGQVIAFQHFVSSSVALTVAENFSGRKTVFEFQGLYNGTAMAVWDHSYYTSEKEYLLSPFQVFEVDSVHIGNYYTRYVLIKHQLPAPCDKQKKVLPFNMDITGNSLRAEFFSGGVVHGSSPIMITLFMFCYVLFSSI